MKKFLIILGIIVAVIAIGLAVVAANRKASLFSNLIIKFEKFLPGLNQ